MQRPFESVVTELSEDAFVGSAIEKGTTVIQFDLRKLDLQRVWATPSPICWRKEPYAVEIHALSTFHNPIKYRFIVAQGCYLNDQTQRVYFPPDIQGVSPSQPMSPSVIRLACYLAVVCGGSLRHLALLFSVLFLMPMTQSSIKRWLDDIGVQLPTPEAMLRQLLALAPAPECPIAGAYPLGTDPCVMVVKDEQDRLLITHDVTSEHGEEARQCLQRGKDLGLKVTAAFADDSQSFTAAIKAVSPQARLPADHFHTVKHIWGHRNKALLASRRQSKASGADKKDAQLLALAKQRGQLRWSLLKQPGHVSVEEKPALAELAREDEGLVQRFRNMIRQLVPIFAHTHSAAQAKLRRHQLRRDIHGLEDRHLEKIPQCFEAHWAQALRYLRKKGMGKHRRGSNSASGMRLLCRLEKNQDGVRSAATRPHYVQLSQAIKYLSWDVADFLEKGPQLAALPDV